MAHSQVLSLTSMFSYIIFKLADFMADCGERGSLKVYNLGRNNLGGVAGRSLSLCILGDSTRQTLDLCRQEADIKDPCRNHKSGHSTTG